MFKRIFKLLIIGLIIFLFQGCTTHSLYPGFYSPRLGPRMIQPIPQNGNVNALPQNSNFVQSYSKYKKSKTHSQFGALVRIIEFEYDIKDTFAIIPRITSGFDEGEMTGLLTILVDQYELTYQNPMPHVREYVEVVSYESAKSYPQNRQSYNPSDAGIIVSPEGEPTTVYPQGSISTIQNEIQEKQYQVINRSQLYNSAKYQIENEDVRLLLRSKSLSYVIHLQNANLTIYPTKEQIRILKRMIQQHYR